MSLDDFFEDFLFQKSFRRAISGWSILGTTDEARPGAMSKHTTKDVFIFFQEKKIFSFQGSDFLFEFYLAVFHKLMAPFLWAETTSI